MENQRAEINKFEMDAVLEVNWKLNKIELVHQLSKNNEGNFIMNAVLELNCKLN